jgi:hypothetical protein
VVSAVNAGTAATTAASTVNQAVTVAGTAATTTGTAINEAVTVATTTATTAGDAAIVASVQAGAAENAIAAQIPKPLGFAVGSWQIPQDTLAMVHQDEMVVPAREAAVLRSKARGFGDLPRFELGAWEISRDQAGFLHKGESVMPANAADNLRELLTGGGNTTNGDVNLHYAPTVNAPAAPDLEQLLHRQGQTMLGWINAQMRSGALRPPPG